MWLTAAHKSAGPRNFSVMVDLLKKGWCKSVNGNPFTKSWLKKFSCVSVEV